MRAFGSPLSAFRHSAAYVKLASSLERPVSCRGVVLPRGTVHAVFRCLPGADNGLIHAPMAECGLRIMLELYI